MNIHAITKTVEKAVIDNSPTILTAVGVVGVVGTSYLSFQAGWKCCEDGMLEEAKRTAADPNAPVMTRSEIVKLNWRKYVPPVCATALTVGAVVGANRISVSRTVALASAYALSQEKFSDYKDKVREIVSPKKQEEITTGLAEDGVKKNPPSSQVIFVGTGEVMFKDSWSGRYFMSDMESVRKAVNDVNYEIRTGSYCSLTSFYHMIGLDATFDSDEIGWNDDTQLEVKFSTILHEGKPIIVFDFDVIPIRGYYQGHA